MAESILSESEVAEIRRRADAVVDAAIAWHESGQEGDDSWFDKGEALERAIDLLLELRRPPEKSHPAARIYTPVASFQPPDTCPDCIAGVPFDAEGRHIHERNKDR